MSAGTVAGAEGPQPSAAMAAKAAMRQAAEQTAAERDARLQRPHQALSPFAPPATGSTTRIGASVPVQYDSGRRCLPPASRRARWPPASRRACWRVFLECESGACCDARSAEGFPTRLVAAGGLSSGLGSGIGGSLTSVSHAARWGAGAAGRAAEAASRIPSPPPQPRRHKAKAVTWVPGSDIATVRLFSKVPPPPPPPPPRMRPQASFHALSSSGLCYVHREGLRSLTVCSPPHTSCPARCGRATLCGFPSRSRSRCSRSPGANPLSMGRAATGGFPVCGPVGGGVGGGRRGGCGVHSSGRLLRSAARSAPPRLRDRCAAGAPLGGRCTARPPHGGAPRRQRGPPSPLLPPLHTHAHKQTDTRAYAPACT